MLLLWRGQGHDGPCWWAVMLCHGTWSLINWLHPKTGLKGTMTPVHNIDRDIETETEAIVIMFVLLVGKQILANWQEIVCPWWMENINEVLLMEEGRRKEKEFRGRKQPRTGQKQFYIHGPNTGNLNEKIPMKSDIFMVLHFRIPNHLEFRRSL